MNGLREIALFLIGAVLAFVVVVVGVPLLVFGNLSLKRRDRETDRYGVRDRGGVGGGGGGDRAA